jgi:uncharacterized membrane protein
MTTLAYTTIALLLAITLNSRRLGFGNWQSWVIYALVGVAGILGRFA